MDSALWVVECREVELKISTLGFSFECEQDGRCLVDMLMTCVMGETVMTRRG